MARADHRVSPHVDAQARQHILDAARGLLGERGPGITLFEIAAEVGLDLRCDDYASAEAPLVASLLGLRLDDVAALIGDLPDQARGRIGLHVSAATGELSWQDAVAVILADRLDRPSTSLESVAQELTVSPRTLQGRLADEVTHWRALIDATRRERASELLRQGVPVQAAAPRVGYSGSRALRRALARWDGEQGR